MTEELLEPLWMIVTAFGWIFLFAAFGLFFAGRPDLAMYSLGAAAPFAVTSAILDYTIRQRRR